MITGYNHNIKHTGRVYHIQTEDSGLQYPHIITHLFVGGNIIHSHKCSYAHLLEENLQEDEEKFEKVIRGMMKEQHKKMLKELKAGKHDHIGARKSSGSLLTPGLLSLGGNDDSGDSEESLVTKTSEQKEPGSKILEEPPKLSVDSIFGGPSEAPSLPVLSDIASPLASDPVPVIEPITAQKEEASDTKDKTESSDKTESTDDVASSRKRGRGRLGRARPAFAAPPPSLAPDSGKNTPVPPSTETFSPDQYSHDVTLLDIRPFGHAFATPPAKETPPPVSTPAPASGTNAKRSMRNRRGSGRGQRPELQFNPPSATMTPPPSTISSPIDVTSAPSPIDMTSTPSTIDMTPVPFVDASPTFNTLPAMGDVSKSQPSEGHSFLRSRAASWLTSTDGAIDTLKLAPKVDWTVESESIIPSEQRTSLSFGVLKDTTGLSLQTIASHYLKKDKHI